MRKSICPRCGFPYYEPPALSRWDSATEVCSSCGMHEAMIQWVMQNGADRSAPRELVEREVAESVHPRRGIVKWSKIPRGVR